MVRLENVTFSYKDKKNVISNFSLNVENGEFVTLLGPSGCGKTTLLRLIAGFLEPRSGNVYIDGVKQKNIPANKRQVGVVFQDYALFPHLNVARNISYPLEGFGKSIKKEFIRESVAKIANLLNIDTLLDRFVYELSGGQQQRVALARSLVQNPKVLLMDEPLSSLDFKLRENIRQEIKVLSEKLKITTIYVTHDRQEAFYLSNRIAIINNGILEQFSTPEDIYFYPCNDFVASFSGKSNYFTYNDEKIIVRPEWFVVNKEEGRETLKAKIISKQFLGEQIRLMLLAFIDGKNIELIADIPSINACEYQIDNYVFLKIAHKIKL